MQASRIPPRIIVADQAILFLSSRLVRNVGKGGLHVSLSQVPDAGLAVVAVTIGSIAYAADVLEQFRLTEEDAHQGVFDSLWSGAPAGAGSAPSIFRTLAPQARATAVTAAAAFVRAYCESDAFRQSYAARRQAERPPDMPETTGAKADLDKSMAKMDESMAETRAALANLPRRCGR